MTERPAFGGAAGRDGGTGGQRQGALRNRPRAGSDRDCRPGRQRPEGSSRGAVRALWRGLPDRRLRRPADAESVIRRAAGGWHAGRAGHRRGGRDRSGWDRGAGPGPRDRSDGVPGWRRSAGVSGTPRGRSSTPSRMGKIDHWVTRPVQSPDEEFHESITRFLGEWSSRHGGGFEPVQVIGEHWSARSQELRDTFSRNGIPIGFYDAGSGRGRQMLHELGAEFGRTAGGRAPLRRTAVSPGQPVEPGDRRRVRPDDTDPRRRGVRCRGGGRRPGGPGRRGLCLLRGPADRGHRAGGHRRPGGNQFDDP